MEEKQKQAVPRLGFLRLSEVLRLIPVGRSTWWSKVKSGEYPKPVKLGPRTTAWAAEDIAALIERIKQNG